MRQEILFGAVAMLAMGIGPALAANMPIQLSAGSFDQNVVMGSGNESYTAVTAGMDGGVYGLANSSNNPPPNSFSEPTYYLQGYDGTGDYNNGNSTSGLPLGQTITSQANANTTFAFQSPTATDNAAVLTEQTGATTGKLTLTSPAAYSTLAFLGVDNNASIAYTINFQGGGTQAGTLTFPGWFTNGPSVAYSAAGRVFLNGTVNANQSVNITGVGGFDQSQHGVTSGDLVFEQDVTVTDTTDPIESISLSINGGGSNSESDAIFALSGQAVSTPEPASLGLLSMSAASILMKRRGQRA